MQTTALRAGEMSPLPEQATPMEYLMDIIAGNATPMEHLMDIIAGPATRANMAIMSG